MPNNRSLKSIKGRNKGKVSRSSDRFFAEPKTERGMDELQHKIRYSHKIRHPNDSIPGKEYNAMLKRSLISSRSDRIFNHSPAASSSFDTINPFGKFHQGAVQPSQIAASSSSRRKATIVVKESWQLSRVEDDLYTQPLHWATVENYSSGLILFANGIDGRDLGTFNPASKNYNTILAPFGGEKITALSQLANMGHFIIGGSEGQAKFYDVKHQKFLMDDNHSCMENASFHQINSIQPYGDHGCLMGFKCGHVIGIDGRLPSEKSFLISLPDVDDKHNFPCDIQFRNHNLCIASNIGGWSIYDDRMLDGVCEDATPSYKFSEYKAAITSLAFHPTKDEILAVGTGSADQRIEIFNLNTKEKVGSYKTGAQVTGLEWVGDLEFNPFLVASLGYGSNAMLSFKFQKDQLELKDEIAKHENVKRIIGLSRNRNGHFFASSDTDNQLNIWQAQEDKAERPKQFFGDKIYCGR